MIRSSLLIILPKLPAGMVDEGTWWLSLGYVGGGWQTVELSQPKLEALVDPGAAVQVVKDGIMAGGRDIGA